MRLFLALYPPRPRAEEFVALVPQRLERCRPSPPDQVHCTVFFLGDRADRELDETTASAEACCAGLPAFSLRPTLLTALPERGPKRTVVVCCDRPATLLEIHDRAVRRFARQPRSGARERFLPHLTVGRFGGAGESIELDVPLELEPFEVAEIRLVESRLRPTGAVHRDVAVFPLGERTVRR